MSDLRIRKKQVFIHHKLHKNIKYMKRNKLFQPYPKIILEIVLIKMYQFSMAIAGGYCNCNLVVFFLADILVYYSFYQCPRLF